MESKELDHISQSQSYGTWLECTNNETHHPGDLKLTQFIPGDALDQINNKIKLFQENMALLKVGRGGNDENDNRVKRKKQILIK